MDSKKIDLCQVIEQTSVRLQLAIDQGKLDIKTLTWLIAVTTVPDLLIVQSSFNLARSVAQLSKLPYVAFHLYEAIKTQVTRKL